MMTNFNFTLRKIRIRENPYSDMFHTVLWYAFHLKRQNNLPTLYKRLTIQNTWISRRSLNAKTYAISMSLPGKIRIADFIKILLFIEQINNDKHYLPKSKNVHYCNFLRIKSKLCAVIDVSMKFAQGASLM